MPGHRMRIPLALLGLAGACLATPAPAQLAPAPTQLAPARAQLAGAPWTARLRGAWVRSGAAAPGDVVLAAHGAGSVIVVAAGEPENVRQAARFLAGDIERISGWRPPIVDGPEASARGQVQIRLQTLGNGKDPAGVDVRALRGQWEAYRVVTRGPVVWLIGSNARGTAFAAYTLSERLGVDPLYLWTGYVPERHDPLVLRATAFTQGPPTFRFRGFFHDDEDILPRPFDARGYPLQTGDVPLEWYRRFFETALRLRLNMVAPYVRVHRRYEVQKLASEWGLYFTSHHYDILLSNPWGLERFNLAVERGVKPEWNWFTNRDGMLKYWRAGVLENRELDAIWPVGMRGTADRPYTFPPGTTDEQKAAAFREAIHDQVAMVRQELPSGKTPLFHFTMYTEMLDEYRRNPAAFDLPADVIIVWPDDNDGHMRALPTELGKWKHGVYYHLAYLGGNLSKQVTHVVAPATIAGQFDRIVKAGATEFMLLNVSELREYVMGARMIADITWNAPAALGAPDAADRYVDWWAREYFGPGDVAAASAGSPPARGAGPDSGRVGDAATAVAAAYRRYFAVLDAPDRLWYAADAIQNLLDRLYHRVGGQPYPPMNADTLAALEAQQNELRHALGPALGDRLARPQLRFYREDVELGLMVAFLQTEAALALAEALKAPNETGLWQQADVARSELEELEARLAWAEYPPFDRWYHETWIRSALSRNNPHRSYTLLRAFIAGDGHGELAREVPPGPGR